MRTEEMYVALVVLMVLGILFNASIYYLTRWLTPWHQRTE
jgi:ABC-type nitrate/sulfonate/bicarbonate transport system permease component